MDHEDYQHDKIVRLQKTIDELVEDNRKMRAALLIISEWKNPYSGFSYYYGYNGERDYFKKIAQEAL